MRIFHLRLAAADFVQVGARWTSAVTLDLYDNASYRNFSLTRSVYGLNSLGDGTWTGLRKIDPTTTDTGKLTGGRYLDTSGRIDLVSWYPDISLVSGTGPVSAALTVFSAISAGSVFPDEFSWLGPIPPSQEINLVGAPRYVRFQVDFDAPAGTVYTGTIYVRVEIDIPLMAPLYGTTRRLLDQYPEWMALREADYVPATPELATPSTVGSKFLNAAAGEWLDQLTRSLGTVEFETYIDTAELSQVAWAYRASLLPQFVYSITGDGVQLARAFDLEEFYAVSDTADICFLDEEQDALYTRKSYNVLLVNGALFAQEPRLVRNAFDEIGLFVDLTRHRLESNESFRHRILDVYRNRPGAGVDAFKLALRRELNIWKTYGATPSSDYLGATPEVLEISDLESDPLYIAPDGMPTQRFTDLVDKLAVAYPTTWGRFRWDKSFWDLGGLNHEGYNVLPYRMDATPLALGDTQPGIGDASDLLLLRPDAITGPHTFSARLKLRGRQKTTRTEYPRVTFDFDVYGRSDRKVYTNPTKTIWLTVEIETFLTGNPVYTHSFLISSRSDVDVDRPNPSPASYGVFRFLDDDGTGTDDALTFSHKVNGSDFPGGNQYPGGKIPTAKIKKITIRGGKWDIESQSYLLTEVSDTFDVWFSHLPGSVLQYNTSAGSAPSYNYSASAPQSPIVLKSKVTSFIVGKFVSERFPYRLSVNTAVPATAARPVDVAVPAIVWDPYQESTPNREIVVELKTRDATGTYGAQTLDEGGGAIFLPSSYLLVNGNATWTASGSQKSFSSSTPTFTFSVGSGAAYPLTATVWTIFEANQLVPLQATVDENGPWRNNQAPALGNTNFTLQTANVTRASFGVPNASDRVITWMGIEVLNDPQVVCWLDSNSVKPAVVDASSVDYPANAINERLNAGVYSFDSFVIRARLRPQVAPAWNPYVHSGWYYQAGREGYLYANPVVESATPGAPANWILAGVVRQGAPIAVRTTEATPRDLRQVVFFRESATPDPATPTTPSLVNKQAIKGTGTTTLYLAYPDVYAVTVKDLTTGLTVSASTSSTTNRITTSGVTDPQHDYEVTYTLARSFIADHEYEHPDGTQRTKLTFDKAPSALGVPSYSVTYESSRFDPATPLDLPLSPLHTSFNEGYVFLSHNEYTLDQVEVVVSPTKIVADGSDYLVVSLRSLDRYGNPKAKQTLTLSSSFGAFSASPLVVTTDDDGFATAVLTAGTTITSAAGTITITGATTATANFEIDTPAASEFRLVAIPAADQIPADGSAQNVVFGKVEDPRFRGYPYATIRWRRARTLFELFTGALSAAATPSPQVQYTFSSAATPVTPPAATPVVTRTQTTTRPSPPVSRGCMHGFYSGSNSFSQIQTDGTNLGKAFAVCRFYNQWGNTVSAVQSAVNAGKLVLSSHKPPQGGGGWGAIANGAEDARIDQLAVQYKNYNREIVFIFHHEPHDDASDLKGGADGTSDEYRRAFRRIVERFRAKGANNVKFGYCASSPWPIKHPDKCYPGDDVVDVFCHDKYNWYAYQGNPSWEKFADQWKPYVQLSKEHDKPLIIGEFGSHPSDTGTNASYNRDQWFRDAATYIKNDADASRYLIGFCYYHTTHVHDWRFMDTSGNPIDGGKQGWIDAFVSDSYFKATPFPVDIDFAPPSDLQIIDVTLAPHPATPTTAVVSTGTAQTTFLPGQEFSGSVIADAAGNFTIGPPFIASAPAQTGYWFVSAEMDAVVYDTFDRTAGSLVNADSGEVWSQVQSNFSVGNNYGAVSAAATAMSVLETGRSDVAVEVVLDDSTTGGTAAVGPVLRYVDTSNYIYVIHSSRTQFRIRKVQSGTHSDITSAVDPSPAIAASTRYTVRLEAKGTTLRLYVNGILLATATSSFNQVATKHGIRNSGGDTAARVESFLVARTDTDAGLVGDVVFWHEYPDTLFGVDPHTRLPRRPVQDATPISAATPYSRTFQFPTYYDEGGGIPAATPVYGTSKLNWLPPRWYALAKYQQYQLGLLGLTRGQATPSSAVHKFQKLI